MKPILFNTEMVKAILEGRKTATRRVVKTKSVDLYKSGINGENLSGFYMDRQIGNIVDLVKPPYKVGDILYIRETWQESECFDWNIKNQFCYKANKGDEEFAKDYNIRWRPSIHMPKAAARIFLKVTDVRVERIQDMTQEDCVKEGCGELSEEQFAQFWNGTIKKQDLDKYSWKSNPWVWVIKFERVEVE